MPNFKCKNVNLVLPNQYNDIKYDFQTVEQRGRTLIHTTVLNKSFFIELNNKDNEFVVKIDKLSKITNLALMQKALEGFESLFCEGVISKSYSYNKNKELANNIISSVDEFKNIIEQSSYEKIFIEIGFGSGRHLLYQAKNNTNNLYIGIEIHKPSLIQVSKLAKELENVLLLDFDARIALKALKEHCLDGLYLHFPVPWDDAPYRRVVSNEFKIDLFKVLKEGGFFELRSDSKMYAYFTFDVFKEYEYEFIKNRDSKIVSKYEDRWLRMNKDIYDFRAFKRKTINTIKNSSKENNRINFKINLSTLKQLKYVGEDYFIKVNKIFDFNDGKIAHISYGGFDTPSSSYIMCKNNEEFRFMFFDFCATTGNIKSILKLKELLNEK